MLCLFTFSFSAAAEELTVRQLIDGTLSSNPEIAAYEAEVRSFEAVYSVAGRMQNPELDFGIGRIRSTGDGNGEVYSAGINQPIDWPGRLSLKEAIARHDMTLAELGLERFKAHLASQVHLLAQKIVSNQNILETSNQIAERYEALRETLHERNPAGIAAQIELSAIEAATVVAETKATEAKIALRSAILDINQLSGLDITKETRVIGTGFKLLELPSDKDLFRLAAENNYDIRIKRSQLEQKGFEVDLAKNERYPTFTLGPYISQESTREEEKVVGLNLSIPLPIWDSGAAKVSHIKEKQKHSEVQLSLQQREVEKRLIESSLMFRTYKSRFESYNIDALSRSASEAENHYQLGGVDISNHITMQDIFFNLFNC